MTVYNSTSFPFAERHTQLPEVGPLRLVYLGTFNYWHDMGEVARVMRDAARQLGCERTEIFVYTLPKFHAAARRVFGAVECARLAVEYVAYSDVPKALSDKHVGISVVRPSLSSRIASPIKVADYVALGLFPLLNRGIGDFDEHFRVHRSAVLYEFGGNVDLSGLHNMTTEPNKTIYELVCRRRAAQRLAAVIEQICNG